MKDTLLCTTFGGTYNAECWWVYSDVVIAYINTMDVLAIVAAAVKTLVLFLFGSHKYDVHTKKYMLMLLHDLFLSQQSVL